MYKIDPLSDGEMAEESPHSRNFFVPLRSVIIVQLASWLHSALASNTDLYSLHTDATLMQDLHHILSLTS